MRARGPLRPAIGDRKWRGVSQPGGSKVVDPTPRDNPLHPSEPGGAPPPSRPAVPPGRVLRCRCWDGT